MVKGEGVSYKIIGKENEASTLNKISGERKQMQNFSCILVAKKSMSFESLATK